MKKRLFCSVVVSVLIAVLFSTAVFGQESRFSVVDEEEYLVDVTSAEDPDAILTESAAPLDSETPLPYDEAAVQPDPSGTEWAEEKAPEAYDIVPVYEEPADSEEMTGDPANACGANAVWELSSGTLTISGTGDMYNYSGTDRPPWYEKRSQIKSIYVEDGITRIGAYAFGYLSNLTTVSLPASVKKLGAASFCFCTSLKVVEIPAGVTVIDAFAFYKCTGIKRVTFLGAAPSIYGESFTDVYSIVYYPSSSSGWTASVRQDYGGSLIWKSVSAYYNVWVCGIRVNSANKEDVLGDGSTSYNSSTRKLTMASPEFMNGACFRRSDYGRMTAVIYTPGKLSIQGNFYMTANIADYSIYVEDELTINNSDTRLGNVFGQYNFTCKGTRILADRVHSSVLEFDDSEVYADRLTTAAGNLNITDSFVYISNDDSYAPIQTQGCVIVNSYVKVTNKGGDAIDAYGVFRINGSELIAEGKSAGVYSGGFDIQKGNTITAEGAEGAMFGYYEPGGNSASEEFRIVPGYVFIEPADATVGTYGILSNGKNATRVNMRMLETADKAALYYNNAAAKEVTIPTKSTARLRLKTKDGYSVTAKWTSGNPEIASVDQNGLVTAHKYGKTKISCNTGSKTLTCNVNTLFYDVTDPNQPGYKQIYWGVDKGIIGGFGGVYFGPEQPCTRLQFAIMVWRMKGKPAASGSLSFSDMKSLSTTSDSYKAVLWAVKNGIIKGYSDNTFRPNNNVTREQIVIMLWRLAGQPKATKPLTFKDTTNLSKSSTSYQAIAWAGEAGIVNGFSDNTFRKDENSKRNQIIIMIYRFVNKGYSG